MDPNNGTFYAKLAIRDALCRDLENRRETLLSEVVNLTDIAVQVKRNSAESIWKSYQNVQSELISLCGSAEDIPELLSDADFASHIYVDILTILEEGTIKREIKEEAEEPAVIEQEEDLPKAEAAQSGPTNKNIKGSPPSHHYNFREISKSVNNLLNVDNNSIKKTDPEKIMSFIKKVQDSLFHLRQFDIGVEHWSPIVCLVMLSKLDGKTRNLFDCSQFKGEIPNHERLLDFLAIYADSLIRDRKRSDLEKELKLPAQSLCPLCPHGGKSHNITKCAQFRAMTNLAKTNTIMRLRLCKRCLSDGHFAKSCVDGTKCRNCGMYDHHELTCRPKLNNQPCPTLKTLKAQERRSLDLKVKACFNCHDAGHRVRACPTKSTYLNGGGKPLAGTCSNTDTKGSSNRRSLPVTDEDGKPQPNDSPISKKIKLDDSQKEDLQKDDSIKDDSKKDEITKS